MISAETFSDKIESVSHCHKIVRFFDAIGMKTVFIVFLRDVPAYMNSRYVQDAKNLRTEASFKAYLRTHRGDRAYDYPLVLKSFEAAAPVKVLPYTRQGQVIERRFLESMGRGPRDFDQLTWNSLPYQNTSPGPKALHIARQIAARLPTHISTKELHFKRKRFKFLAERFGLNDTGFVGCDNRFADTIREAFAGKTDDIARRYFDESWTRTVPPETMFDRYSDDPAQTEAPRDVQEEIIRRVLAARPTFLSRTRHRFLSAIRHRLN